MIKLHIGCGKRYFSAEWDHIDAASFPHIKWTDIYCSSYEHNSVDVIYASHLIAYFDRTEIIKLLASWLKVLKPMGVLRIATPDFDTLSKLYNSDIQIERLLGPLYGKMEINNKISYHKTCWDKKSLFALLHNRGFNNIKLYDHKKTDHAQYDDHSAAYINGKLISLNVECNK